jgi:hypothetical protein
MNYLYVSQFTSNQYKIKIYCLRVQRKYSYRINVTKTLQFPSVALLSSEFNKWDFAVVSIMTLGRSRKTVFRFMDGAEKFVSFVGLN